MDEVEPVVGEPDDGAGGFETWFRATWPRLVTAVAVQTGDRALAEDAVAVAMTKVHDRWGRPGLDRPDAWAFRVAVNQARRSWRRWARLHSGDEIRVTATDDAPPDIDLWRAVASLPAREREAVVRRYVLDQTQADAAADMGVAPGTVATLLHRARAHLEAGGLLR